MSIHVKATVSAQKVLADLGRLEDEASGAIEGAFEDLGHDIYERVNTSDEFKRQTGALHSSIRWKKRSPNVLRVFTDARVPYASFVNDGTRAHTIEARGGGMLRFVAAGSTVYARRVQHPGTKATRFFDQAVAEAFTEAERDLPRRLEPSIKRFNR